MAQAEVNLQADLKTLSRRSYLVFSLTFFLCILAFIVWGIIPQINGIFDNHKHLATVQQERDNLTTKLRQIQQVPSDPDFSQATLVNNILYTNNPSIEVLYSLNQVATQSGVTFSRFEFSPGLIATPSAQFSLNQNAQTAAARYAQAQNLQNQGFTIFIEARAPYLSLVNFLHQLESYAPFQSVAYSEISNTLSGNASAKIEILASYYSPDVRATLTDPLPQLTTADKQLVSRLSDFRSPELSDLDQQDLVGGKNDLFTLGGIPQGLIDQAVNEQAGTPTP